VSLVSCSVAVAVGFRGAALTRTPRQEPLHAQARLSHHLRQSERDRLLWRGIRRRLLRARAVSLSRAFLFELGRTSLVTAGVVIAGFAVGGLFYTMSVSRFLPRLGVNGMMSAGAALVGLQLAIVAFGPGWKVHGDQPAVHGAGAFT